MPTDEDYYKPKIIDSAFSSNYIQYEGMGDAGKEKNLSVEEYLHKMKPYLRDIINDHKTQGTKRIHSFKVIENKTQSEWKIQLIMKINSISSLPDSDETCITHKRSDNIELMMRSETEEVIKELFGSPLKRYKKTLEESMDGSHFTFDDVNALYYDLNTVSSSRGNSYIGSPKLVKSKKVIINPKIDDGNCFQYALTVALNHEQITSHPEEYQKLRLLLINTIGKKQILLQALIHWKSLHQIMNQLLLIFYMCLIMLKK